MKTMIKPFAKVIILIDLALVLYGIIFQNSVWVLNTQIAFVSSLFISIATFFSYQRSIKKRLENTTVDIDTVNDRDKIDEIDDPFDLYSEDVAVKEKELSAHEIKQIIQEEKAKVKRNSLKNTFTNAGSFVSLYRIIGYAVLIIGFFFLNNHQLLMPIAYLIGLFVTPLSMLMLKFMLQPTEEEASQS
jgi:uncharacterized membrane protein YiaA